MKKKTVRTRVSAIKCHVCGDTIYSCAHHDFRSCSCGACFIDGGFEYTRVGGNPEKMTSLIKYINATRKELYDDWNQNGERIFGCIKPS